MVLTVAQYGQIVRYVRIEYDIDLPTQFFSSARVMRNEVGESRGFGFVSFQTPDQGLVVSFVYNI